MAQNRKAPAYQEYATSMLSDIHFRMMSMPERGLLWTMRMECWVNEKLPSDKKSLAKLLNISEDELLTFLPSVMHYFNIEGDLIICPELEDYRTHLKDRREKQIKGGRKGADHTNKIKKGTTSPSTTSLNNSSATPTGNPSTTPTAILSETRQLSRRVGVGSLVESSQGQHSPSQPKNTVTNIENISNYHGLEDSDADNPYANVSNGD